MRLTGVPRARQPTVGTEPGASAGAVRRLARAYLAWVLLVTFVVVAGAAMLSWSRTPIYRSEVDVLAEPRQLSKGSAPLAPDMGTERALAMSGAVVSAASRTLGVPPDVLSSGLSVSVPLNTDVLHIYYSDPSPAEAHNRAEGLANAYVAYRGPTHTSIISPASMPTAPSSPNHKLDVGIAIVVGLALGIGTAMIRDRFDDRLRGPVDFEAQSGCHVHAVIPAFRPVRRDVAGRLVMVRAPHTAAAEAYRSLRTRVLQVAKRRAARTLLVTSPGGEEKTAVAANLAVALAQSRRRVILVCADLRWGWAHQLFGLDNDAGLTDVADGDISLVHALRSTEITGLHVLPAGDPTGDPGAVLQAPAVPPLLAKLRERADFVIIDGPALLAGADAGALAELAEMVLFVADARASTRRQVRAAVDQIDHLRAKLIGGVLGNSGRRTRLPKPPRPPRTKEPMDIAPLAGGKADTAERTYDEEARGTSSARSITA